jgi:site-specific recombinase XerD
MDLPAPITNPAGALQVASSHADLLALWLASLEQDVVAGQRSAATVTSYRSSVRAWSAWLARGDIPRPEPRHVTEFLASAGAHRAPATRNRHLHALRSCYRWTENQGLYPAIARSARSLVVHRDDPLPCFTRSQIEAVLAAVDQISEAHRARSPAETVRAGVTRLRDLALIRVMFGTGLRLVSLVRADVEHLDLDSDPPTIRHQPKGHFAADATAMLAAGTVACLREYLAERAAIGLAGGPLWISLHAQPGLRLTAWSMRRIVTRAAERARLAARGTDGRLLQPRLWGPHAIRRAAATIVTDAFGLEAGQALLNHQSIDTTRRAYVRVQRWRLLERARHTLDLGTPPSPAAPVAPVAEASRHDED